MKLKPTCFLLMFMKSIVTVGGRHFDPLFDIPIELPTKTRITENYLDRLETQTSTRMNNIIDIFDFNRN